MGRLRSSAWNGLTASNCPKNIIPRTRADSSVPEQAPTLLWRNMLLRSNRNRQNRHVSLRSHRMTGSRGPGPSRSKKTDQNPNRSQQIIYKRNLGKRRNEEEQDEDQGQDEEDVKELERSRRT
ncbi:BQ5605_C017g08537 [Microbotryum silenes-dioicae]|uniref:BQ5605_C017g08537 protein n=1 Tax=Microbotryum silenes-dioicae TaxID=796604 RepID=A0A2X0LUZ4_9BASI|nr:BQ5605_C017g08537 [Microbotryum silenes-dioicae]